MYTIRLFSRRRRMSRIIFSDSVLLPPKASCGQFAEGAKNLPNAEADNLSERRVSDFKWAAGGECVHLHSPSPTFWRLNDDAGTEDCLL